MELIHDIQMGMKIAFIVIGLLLVWKGRAWGLE